VLSAHYVLLRRANGTFHPRREAQRSGVGCKRGLGRGSILPFAHTDQSKLVIPPTVERARRMVASALVAPSERRGLLQADALHERISMPMHKPPFGPFTAKDLCDTQRPVLLW